MSSLVEQQTGSIDEWKEQLNEELSSYFFKRMERVPMIMPIILELESKNAFIQPCSTSQ